MIIAGTSSLAKQQMKEQGPDDFMNNIQDRDVFQCIILDEAGPFFLQSGPIIEKVYIMVAVELVTNRSHLIPIKDTLAKSLIRALETLQRLRGQLSTIIIHETNYLCCINL